MVLRHGHVVAEGWWSPYTPERVHLLYSLSKSFTSAAAGFAVAEGLLDYDATVLSYFPELDEQVSDTRSRSMRVGDIAAMASGHLADTIDVALAAEDPILAFLRMPPDRAPGSVFAYNQLCTYTLAAIVQRLTGQTLTDYLWPRLFAPLGITDGAWQQNPTGRDLGFSGLHLTTEDIACFGQLLLDDGAWAGRPLLPEGWVARATREHVPTFDSDASLGGPDWAQGYGMQFWHSRHGYRGDGAYGQFAVVLPEHDVVLATTGACDDMQAVLEAAWAHLLPACGAAPGTPSAAASTPADERLAERLATLALPPMPPGHAPAAESPWDAAVLRLADATHLRGILDVTLQRSPSASEGGWTVSVHAWDGAVTARVGLGEWVVTDPGGGAAPIAVSAGWTDAGQVVVDLILLETPHRLRLTGELTTGTLRALWHTEPLSGVSLRSMQRPLGPATTRTPAADGLELRIEPSQHPMPEQERRARTADPGFGRVFTDHMVTIRWSRAVGWHDARLTAYGPLALDPASVGLHYGQSIFEGFKAYRQPDGGIAAFRPEANARRFQASARRLCLPELPVDTFVAAVEALVHQDADWVPDDPAQSLYLRPFMLATETVMTVRPADECLFVLIAFPAGSYFPRGVAPVSVWVTEQYARAWPGGTGAAKCGANYAAGLLAQIEAAEHGCDQVVWLDAVERRWIEELGGMNLYFVRGAGAEAHLTTPRLTGTLLPGITRDCLLTLASDLGHAVEESRMSLADWRQGCADGEITEVFACGTAAVITPVGSVSTRDGSWTVGDGTPGPVTTRLRETLLAIQTGRAADPHGWRHRID